MPLASFNANFKLYAFSVVGLRCAKNGQHIYFMLSFETILTVDCYFLPHSYAVCGFYPLRLVML